MQITITDKKPQFDTSWDIKGEIFAQLYSYAVGTDNGGKEEIIKAMPNTYKAIQDYIAKHCNDTEKKLDVTM